MVESITLKLARHLHDRHHPVQAWDSCVQGCRDFYSLMADSAILYLKQQGHMKQTLGDQLRQRQLDDKLAAQMEGGE
jgi:hypothetical protein